jgi:hypothetical protein
MQIPSRPGECTDILFMLKQRYPEFFDVTVTSLSKMNFDDFAKLALSDEL